MPHNQNCLINDVKKGRTAWTTQGRSPSGVTRIHAMKRTSCCPSPSGFNARSISAVAASLYLCTSSALVKADGKRWLSHR